MDTLKIDFPAWSVAWSDAAQSVVVGGGGGPGNTGVKNKIVRIVLLSLHDLPSRLILTYCLLSLPLDCSPAPLLLLPANTCRRSQITVRVNDEATAFEQTRELDIGQEAVDMGGLAVCSGKNGQIACGRSSGLKLFALGEKTITALSEDPNDIPAAEGGDELADHKTQITCFSDDGKVLAVADNEGEQVSVYDFPSLKRLTKLATGLKGVRHLALGGVDGERLLCVNGRNGSATVWGDLTNTKDGPKKQKALNAPAGVSGKCDFRGCAFVDSGKALLVGLNVTEGRGRKMKVQAQLVRWSCERWQPSSAVNVLSGCGLTCMHVAPDGATVAVGGSDGTVGVFNAGGGGGGSSSSLSRIFTKERHGLAVTNVMLLPARALAEAEAGKEKEGKPVKAAGGMAAHPALLLSVGLDNQVGARTHSVGKYQSCMF